MNIDLTPLVQPVVQDIVIPLLTAGAVWLGYKVERLLHVSWLDGHRAVFETAVANGLNMADKALGIDGSKPVTVDVKNAYIATAASYIAKTAPGAIKALGLDKDAAALAAAIDARSGIVVGQPH